MKRIAFLGSGGHSLPTYRALLNSLASEYSIVVYSEVPVPQEWLKFDHQYKIRPFKGMGLSTKIREFLFLIFLIRDHLKKPFDLVHAHCTFPTGFSAIVLQKLFRIPTLLSLDGGEEVSFPEMKFGDAHHSKRTMINKWIIKNANVVTTLTTFQRDGIYRNLKIKREIQVIPRGVDTNKFLFRRNNNLNTPIIFLSVGYFSPIKDPETLIKAFFIIQKQVNSKLIHVGKDYMNGLVQRMVDELGISNKVQFIEPVDHNCIHEYYRKSDVFLHTSVYESQALVVAEAMAAGALVCGTNVGLMNDLSGECCLTVPIKEPEALASVVLELLNNYEKMDKLRLDAYRWTENNSLENCTNRFRDIYAQLLTPA